MEKMNSDIYVNPAHKFYGEFVKLVKKALPSVSINDFTVEEFIQMGKHGKYWKIFQYAEEISKLLHFGYDQDFVVVHYKPYYAIAATLAEDKESGITFDNMWDAWDGILRSSRGIVFHRYSGDLVINPYSKFFNIDEREECSVEKVAERAKNATVVEYTEKLDGSMINGRWYNGKLVLASSNNVDRNVSIQLDEAYKIISPNIIEAMQKYHNLTFIFELISPIDPHVVRYDSVRELVLIGIKSTNSEYTFPYKRVREIAKEFRIPHAAIYKYTLDDILKMRDDKKAFEAEGFVANFDGYRVKIKYDDYMKLHNAITNLTPNKIIKAIADEELKDILLACRGREDFVCEVADKVSRYVDQLDREVKEEYDWTLKELGKDCERKAFMIYIGKMIPAPLRKYLIMLYDGVYDKSYLLKMKSGRYTKFDEIEEYLNKLTRAS